MWKNDFYCGCFYSLETFSLNPTFIQAQSSAIPLSHIHFVVVACHILLDSRDKIGGALKNGKMSWKTSNFYDDENIFDFHPHMFKFTHKIRIKCWKLSTILYFFSVVSSFKIPPSSSTCLFWFSFSLNSHTRFDPFCHHHPFRDFPCTKYTTPNKTIHRKTWKPESLRRKTAKQKLSSTKFHSETCLIIFNNLSHLKLLNHQMGTLCVYSKAKSVGVFTFEIYPHISSNPQPPKYRYATLTVGDRVGHSPSDDDDGSKHDDEKRNNGIELKFSYWMKN